MMKQFNYFQFTLLAFLLSCTNELAKDSVVNTTSSAIEHSLDYEIAKNDPFNTRIYTLSNGLKLYLTVNHDQPTVFTQIAVRVGSKQDPTNTTGLAHYLEHMMFKGTSELGAKDWTEESKKLKEISDLYEAHRKEKSEEKKSAIYHQIDSTSYEASKFAIPNEYDMLMTSIGAQKTNAHTFLEETVYKNEIPSNELHKWMKVESQRFRELVLRLFHTELEAVYEEYNIGLTRDGSQVFHLLMQKLFQKHTYGTQTTIGKAEHLKNPSMEKIHEQFDEYYVANNMAIILSGDFDPDEVAKEAEKLFSTLRHKEVKTFDFSEERSQRRPRYGTVYSQNPEYVNLAFRLPGASDIEKVWTLELIDLLLCNGSMGLIDANISRNQKLKNAYSNPYIFSDYSLLMMHGSVLEGQSLESARDLLLSQIDLIKQGQFDDAIIPTLVNRLKLEKSENFNSNEYRVGAITDAYILGVPWIKTVEKFDFMLNLSKEEIVDFANEYFQKNYVVVYKRKGENKVDRFKKPSITPVYMNKEIHSPFFNGIINTPSKEQEFKALDFNKLISNDNITDDVKLSCVENNKPGLFNLKYTFDVGRLNNLKLAFALSCLDKAGTSTLSLEEKENFLFTHGLNFSVNVLDTKTEVTLSGLEESLETGLNFLEEILNDSKLEQESFERVMAVALENRKVANYGKNYIFKSALMNFVKYGEDSPVNFGLSLSELQSFTVNEVNDLTKSLKKYKHSIFYQGDRTSNDVKSVLGKRKISDEVGLEVTSVKRFVERELEDKTIYFVDYDMPQAEVYLYSKLDKYNKDDLVQKLAMDKLFSSYFGSGLSSIMFQEIRESKALAYSTYSFYLPTLNNNKNDCIMTYVGTQIDKLPEALRSVKDLVFDMPEKESQFELAKQSCLKKIENERLKGLELYNHSRKYASKEDIRKEVYEAIKGISMKQLKEYFSSMLNSNKYCFMILGKKSAVDSSSLNEIGDVKHLKVEDLFGENHIK